VTLTDSNNISTASTSPTLASASVNALPMHESERLISADTHNEELKAMTVDSSSPAQYKARSLASPARLVADSNFVSDALDEDDQETM
jgi:hypothetical protein